MNFKAGSRPRFREHSTAVTRRTFLSGGVLYGERDELLVSGQDGPLRLGLLPLQLPVELPPLSPSTELLHGHLLKIETLLQIAPELFNVFNATDGESCSHNVHT